MDKGTMAPRGGRTNTTQTGGGLGRLSLWALTLLFAISTLTMTACSGKTEEEILSEANAMMQEQNLLKATILYKEFLEKFPESQYRLAAQSGLAEAYYRNQEFELCREILDQIIEENGGPASPAGFQPFLTKLRTYMEQEEFEEALALAESTSDSLATAQLPMKQAFQMFLGDLYARNQRLGEALEVYRVILQTDPPTVEDEIFQLELLRRASSIYEAQGQLDQALGMLNDYIENRPNVQILAQLHQMAGRINQHQGDAEAAEAHFAKAEERLQASIEEAEKEENKVSFMLGLANLNYIRGRDEQADASLRDVIDNYPNTSGRAMAMNLLARSKARAQDYETAMNLLQQVVTEYPNTREAGQAVQQAQMIRAIRESDTATTATATPTVATEEVLPLEPAEDAGEISYEAPAPTLETGEPSMPEAGQGDEAAIPSTPDEATEAPAAEETESETAAPSQP